MSRPLGLQLIASLCRAPWWSCRAPPSRTNKCARLVEEQAFAELEGIAPGWINWLRTPAGQEAADAVASTLIETEDAAAACNCAVTRLGLPYVAKEWYFRVQQGIETVYARRLVRPSIDLFRFVVAGYGEDLAQVHHQAGSRRQ